jgi:hypothetical protein
VICLVIRGLGGIAPSQEPPGLVRIQHLPPNRNPLFLRDSGTYKGNVSELSLIRSARQSTRHRPLGAYGLRRPGI